MHGAEFRLAGQAADQRAAVHHRGDLLQPFAEPQAVDRGRNRGAGAEQLVALHAGLEGRVALDVPGVVLSRRRREAR